VLAEALGHERGGGSHGVERGSHRDAGLDRADGVVVEDLDDLGLLDAGHALRALGVVDEQHAPRLGVDEVGARHDAGGPAGAVHHDGRAVVDALDLLRDVVDQVVRPGGERIGVHERAARRGERDHAAGDVAVQRRDRDDRPPLPREGEDVAVGDGPVARDEERDADLDRPPLGVRAIADHHDVALGDLLGQRGDVHGQDPDPPRDLGVQAGDDLALQDVDDRVHRSGGVQPRRLAGLADVPARERALRHDAGQRAVVVDDRHQVAILARHLEADLAHGVGVARGGKPRLHHVPDAQHDVRQEVGLVRPAALQHPPGLGVQLAQPDRDVVVAGIEVALQLGVADRRRDRVGVRIAVPRDVDRRRDRPLSRRCRT
jgi:hypothetical protein